MISIPLYAMRRTCFLLQYIQYFVVLFSFRVVLGVWGNEALMFSLLQAASKARERNPGKNHRYIFNRLLFSSWRLLVHSVDQRKCRIICFFWRKIG